MKSVKLLEVFELLNHATTHQLKNVNICGLMGMATYTENTQQIEQEFADGKVSDDKIETKANELQKIIQVLEEKEARWFELSSKIE